MSDLNNDQKTNLRITFQSIDEVLEQIVLTTDPSAPRSPFSNYAPDATPVQHKVIADYAARTRAVMRRILEDHGIVLPRPDVSAIWSARTRLMSATIAVEELRPQYMRGYGQLSGEATRQLDVIVAQMLDLLRQMSAFLEQGPGRDLRARLERLEKTTQEIELLRELERIITAHGLTEFRSMLDMLIERIESSTFEIAVFGRVSSGKSSLLDYILQTDVLPVGVTPVTSVPTRITLGPQARAIISFADRESIIIEPHELVAFASEQQNPSNTKHVSRIRVELPAPRLSDGITFVDTPGLGSLAASGMAESLAYLPRCDLGIVLVDAASTLTSEDVALAHAIYQAGAGAMILLSKTDVLTLEEQQRVLGYMRDQVQSNLGMEVPVYAVSVKGEASGLCDRWFSEALVPLLHEHRKMTQASMRRKIGALREAVQAVMVSRLDHDRGPKPGPPAEKFVKAGRGLAEALGQLEAAERQRLEWNEEVPREAKRIVDEVAHAGAIHWSEGHAAVLDLSESLATALTRHTDSMAARTAGDLGTLRSALDEAIREAALAIGSDDGKHEALPKASGMPVADRATINWTARRPLLGSLGQPLLYHSIRKYQPPDIEAKVRAILGQYAKRLDEWRRGVLDELRHSLASSADIIESQLQPGLQESFVAKQGNPNMLRDDLVRLEQYVGASKTGG